MSEISTELIKKAVYKLCFEANTCLSEDVYSKILSAYKNTQDKVLKAILQNAKIAYEKKLPLCQDTGQVIVFFEMGQEVKLTGEFIENAVNSAVSECYKENYFRKSVVKNAVFDRLNTKNNTPAIIHTKIVEGDNLCIKVLIKGAGSENKSKTDMMLPTSSEEEIIARCSELIIEAKENACPPMFIGIGIGGTMDKAAILSKEVFVCDSFNEKEKDLALKIKENVNSKTNNNYVLEVKVKSIPTHIACLPIAITINCHSDRTAKCKIVNNEIIFEENKPNFIDFEEEESKKEIFTSNIKEIRELKTGDEIFLTGEIYVARDMAHKKLKELIDNNKELPFEIKDKIIFYAGPCPNRPNEVIGSIGPTTASRMDKYAEELYNLGLLATIGKGDRSNNVINSIKKNRGKYFIVVGGIAALLSKKVIKSDIIAFEELGTEAIYKLKIEKFPVKVLID